MNVVVAPDFRNGTPYQAALAEELESLGVRLRFLSDYRRGLPLFRGLEEADLLHLHWPESYWRRPGLLRALRFGVDLTLSRIKCPLVVTAHNLLPHDAGPSPTARFWQGWSYRQARAVIVHSVRSGVLLHQLFGLPTERLRHIPHGDESHTYPDSVSRQEARRRLGLDLPETTPLALMFGMQRPYKGRLEIIRWWQNRPATLSNTVLANIGEASDPTLRNELLAFQTKNSSLIQHLERQDDEHTMLWHCAADAAIFNYASIFSSGAASLALGFGLPILVPFRCDTLAYDELPDRIYRFYSVHGNLGSLLERAFRTGRSASAQRTWKTSRSWQKVARATHQLYQELR